LGVVREKYPDLIGELEGATGNGEPVAEPPIPDTAALVASLAQINPADQVPFKRDDPLAFDYGDETDGEGTGNGEDSSKMEQQQRDSILKNSSLPPAIASLLGNTALTASLPKPGSQPQTPLQATFTFQHQQQLASLLAAQGLAPLPTSINGNLGPLQTAILPPQQGYSSHQLPQHSQEQQVAIPRDQLPPEFSGISNNAASDERLKKYDPSIELDQIKILTRTLYIGGITPAVTEEMLKSIFVPYQPETIGIYHEKAHAFVKLKTRDAAERAKRDLWNSKAELLGEPLRVLLFIIVFIGSSVDKLGMWRWKEGHL
jgi:hypothetical protein